MKIQWGVIVSFIRTPLAIPTAEKDVGLCTSNPPVSPGEHVRGKRKYEYRDHGGTLNMTFNGAKRFTGDQISNRLPP